MVIYCDNIEAALRRLPNHVCYILEYLVRFVARLQPLTREQSEHVMMRIMAALTHQVLCQLQGDPYEWLKPPVNLDLKCSVILPGH